MCGPAPGNTNLVPGMEGIQEDFSEEVRPKVVVEGPEGRVLGFTLLKDPGRGVAGDEGRKAGRSRPPRAVRDRAEESGLPISTGGRGGPQTCASRA